MKNLKIITASLLIISSTAQAVTPLPEKPFKTKLQKEMDTRGFKSGMPADSLLSLVNSHSDRCTADINSAGNVIVVKTPSGELVLRLGLLSKVSRKDWNTVYEGC